MGTTDNARRNNVRETHTSVENVGKTKSKGIYNKLTKVQPSEKAFQSNKKRNVLPLADVLGDLCEDDVNSRERQQSFSLFVPARTRDEIIK
jgi:hypothetical protein